jgi:sarcosine oxidase gamma subunit
MTWRKAWARSWDEVRYCSERCRRRRGTLDAQLEEALRRLLAARPRSSTVCPSEAARAVDPDAWRVLMEPARAAARRLVAAGEVEITQSGHRVDPSRARGPIRIRRAR